MAVKSRVGGNEIDVALFADVLRRHRKAVVIGLTLTLILTVLSVVRVSPSGISYRSTQTWSNQATLVLTQKGAPELRSVLPSSPGGSSSLADTSRFAGLIDVYATMATSDPVMQVLKRRGLISAQNLVNGANPITATPIVSTVGGGTTPMMTLTAIAATADKATQRTIGATQAFLHYVEQRQADADIPAKDRIEIRVVKSADVPQLVKPRSKAVPMLVLLSGLIATAAVVFTRDSKSRRERALAPSLSATPRREPVTIDPSAGGVHTATPLGPVRAPDAPREERDPAIAVAKRRPTLGSVPDPAAAGAREDGNAEVAHEAQQLRRARAEGPKS